MKRIVLLILLLVPLMMFSGCAWNKTGGTIEKAQTSFQAFENDFVQLSTVSLEREWILRRIIAETALMMDIESKQFSGAAAGELVEKYLEVYLEDIRLLELERAKHMQSLINSKTGLELLEALQKYHKEGVSAEDINKFLTENVVPSIIDIIDQKVTQQDDGGGDNGN
jgi:hypothetical protein